MNDGLTVAPCSFEAAKHAVMRWHYSRIMPSGKLIKLGVWENGRFVGAVLFGRGANNHLGREFSLQVTQTCELVRVALTDHDAPTTQIVALALRWLRRHNPALRVAVSYADTARGHLGIIYQAGGWLYFGPARPNASVILHGRLYHARSIVARYGTSEMIWLREHVDPEAVRVLDPIKHKYVMPLDKAMRRYIAPLALPFPRGQGLSGEPSASQAEGAGSIPAGRSQEI